MNMVATIRRFLLLSGDLDSHLIRASLVTVFLLFGYQNWFEYEEQALIPFISNGPLISWMYPVLGIHGTGWFLGASEWLFCLLLLAGFWSRQVGLLGSLGSCATFIATVTIIPFLPNGWEVSAGGFPAMSEIMTFLIKDIVLLAASFYLLKQDATKILCSAKQIGGINPLDRAITGLMRRFGLLTEDLDYYVLRGSLLIMFFFFGYTKWHPYASQILQPLISHGPLIAWLYPAFGFRGETRFLGASEWTTFLLLYSGIWNKKLGVLGAFASTLTFVGTVTIIPFMPNGWELAAGGFPAMTGDIPFLMKDIVLLAVSIHLLKEDLTRVLEVRPALCAAPTARLP